jgi:hypothetical protein
MARSVDVLERPQAAQIESSNQPQKVEVEDFLPIQGVEDVEFWVGNAYQAA